MSSAGRKPRKQCFVGETLKQLDVRHIVPYCHKAHFYLLRSGKPPTGVPPFYYFPPNCSVDYAYEN